MKMGGNFGWDMPPGHPTGMDRGEVTYTCPDCGHSHDIHYTYDRSVNAFDLEDAPEKCEGCGREIPDKELDNLEEESE
jgi:DNA replicative helicase MCM subunit Mcm2 (Cdc46/Mcm family)